jgi:hypothetical protein
MATALLLDRRGLHDMSGRRSHRRFQVRNQGEGLLRLVHTVRVVDAGPDSIVLVGEAPAVVGERLLLDVHGPTAQASMQVRVESSKPIVIDGGVRHEIRVAMVGSENRSALVTVTGAPGDDDGSM